MLVYFFRQDLADLAYARIKAFPLTYIDTIDDELLRNAAHLKANYPIKTHLTGLNINRIQSA